MRQNVEKTANKPFQFHHHTKQTHAWHTITRHLWKWAQCKLASTLWFWVCDDMTVMSIIFKASILFSSSKDHFWWLDIQIFVRWYCWKTDDQLIWRKMTKSLFSWWSFLVYVKVEFSSKRNNATKVASCQQQCFDQIEFLLICLK